MVPVVAMRAVLVLILLALALPAVAADCGFGEACVDSFQNGVWPDANFAGIEDVTIRNTAASSSVDTLNFGALAVIGAGSTAARTGRSLIRLTLGSYLLSDAVVDSVLLRMVNSVAVGDSMLAAVSLMPWVEGGGIGTTGSVWGDPTTGVNLIGATWVSFWQRTVISDSAWAVAGAGQADS